MPTWLIMMGTQMFWFVLSAVMVIVWMFRPADIYDEKLKEISDANIARLQAEHEAKQTANAEAGGSQGES